MDGDESIQDQTSNQMKTEEAPNYTIGQKLLRSAITRAKEASRYYGEPFLNDQPD